MTGKQPDQQICEIFFLCLDLIRKRFLMCGFSTQQYKRMNALKIYENIRCSALENACSQARGLGCLVALVAAAILSCFSSSEHHSSLPPLLRRRRGKYRYGCHFLQTVNPFLSGIVVQKPAHPHLTQAN